MKDTKVLSGTAYSFEGKMPLRQAIPLGLQHVLAMFVGNLTPLLIITGACGLGVGSEFADLQVSLLQNAMLVAGLVTLLQLFAIGPVGGKVPIIMGTSSGFIGVFNSVVANMGGGVIAYGAIMGASIIGGLMEGVLGFFLKPLRRFFPPVVTGTVVLSIGLSLISVGIASFGGGSGAADYGSIENLLLATRFYKHIFYSDRYHCWLYRCFHHGLCTAYNRCDSRRRGIHKGLGAELGQSQRSKLVCSTCTDASEDHF